MADVELLLIVVISIWVAVPEGFLAPTSVIKKVTAGAPSLVQRGLLVAIFSRLMRGSQINLDWRLLLTSNHIMVSDSVLSYCVVLSTLIDRHHSQTLIAFVLVDCKPRSS